MTTHRVRISDLFTTITSFLCRASDDELHVLVTLMADTLLGESPSPAGTAAGLGGAASIGGGGGGGAEDAAAAMAATATTAAMTMTTAASSGVVTGAPQSTFGQARARPFVRP